MQLADVGFKNSRWGSAHIDIHSKDELKVTWHFFKMINNEQVFSREYPITFRRVNESQARD